MRLSATSEFNVQTTSAIAGVRGTEFGVITAASEGPPLVGTEEDIYGEGSRRMTRDYVPILGRSAPADSLPPSTVETGQTPRLREVRVRQKDGSDKPKTSSLKMT